ncbi:MAG: DUF6259 domain-containing protein [Kiritimatiellia bacterium]
MTETLGLVFALCAGSLTAADLVRLGDAEIGFRMHLGMMKIAGMETSAEEMDALTVVTNGADVTAVWKGHPVLGDNFTATAKFTRQSGGWAYAFGWRNLEGGKLLVETVSFPDVVVPRTETSGVLRSDSHGMGMVHRPDWPFWGWEREPCAEGQTREFQFTALLDEATTSWYIDARDPEARIKKTYAYCRLGLADPKARLGVRIDMPAVPALTRGSDLPWGGFITPFKGGWFEAAQIYKPWAREQKWYKKALTRKDTPHARRLREICLWAWNRGTSEQVAPPLEKFAAESGVPCALDWYWWHRWPQDVGYPQYWPPREGAEKFGETIARLKKKGIYTMLYTNGTSRDMDDPSWVEGGEEGAVVAHSGKIEGTPWNVHMKEPHRLSLTCGEGIAFQKLLLGDLVEIARAGLDAVYLDQVSCCVGNPCWNRRHRHPLGDGFGSQREYYRYLGEIREACPTLALSSEEVSEAFLGEFDSFISLFGTSYERCGLGTLPEFEAVPVWNALYHGAAACFGTYSLLDGIAPWDKDWPTDQKWKPSDEKDWHAMFPNQFPVEFARTVVWGNQPSVHALRMSHMTEAKYAPEYRFMLETVKFYRANRDYLYDGEMLAPGKLDCAKKEVKFMRRGIYTKAGKYGVSIQPALPTVFHSVWSNAGGKGRAFLVNWSREGQAYALDCPAGKAKGVLGPLAWKTVDL